MNKPNISKKPDKGNQLPQSGGCKVRRGGDDTITFDIDYTLRDGDSLEETYLNADELRKIEMPRKNLSEIEVDAFAQSIKPVLWYQFQITGWDNSIIDEYGIPEIVFQGHLQEWVYDYE